MKRQLADPSTHQAAPDAAALLRSASSTTTKKCHQEVGEKNARIGASETGATKSDRTHRAPEGLPLRFALLEAVAVAGAQLAIDAVKPKYQRAKQYRSGMARALIPGQQRIFR